MIHQMRKAEQFITLLMVVIIFMPILSVTTLYMAGRLKIEEEQSATSAEILLVTMFLLIMLMAARFIMRREWQLTI